MIELGEKVPIMSYYDRKSLLINVEFSALHPYTRFPFYVLLPQNKVCQVTGHQSHLIGLKVFLTMIVDGGGPRRQTRFRGYPCTPSLQSQEHAKGH